MSDPHVLEVCQLNARIARLEERLKTMQECRDIDKRLVERVNDEKEFCVQELDKTRAAIGTAAVIFQSCVINRNGNAQEEAEYWLRKNGFDV